MNVSGEVEIVPTVVLELVTVTDAETPGRNCWPSAKFKDESSLAGRTVIVVEAPCVAEKLAPTPLGPCRTKPEGVRRTVAVPEVNPEALAVRVTAPVPTSACA